MTTDNNYRNRKEEVSLKFIMEILQLNYDRILIAE